MARTPFWYVAFRRPNDAPQVDVRNAKAFAAERLAEGCDVSAGTINPHSPKRTIGLAQVVNWLES
jgi:hypothetical protein